MKFVSVSALTAVLIFCGCTTVDNANRVSHAEQQAESTIVFARPDHHAPFFGTYSLGEVVEITYENVQRNAAGQLVVEAGIRYRGYNSWTNWFKSAPAHLTLNTVCNFYREGGIATPVVYSTNHREIVIRRGETFAFKAVCPVKNASRYQIILGE